MNSFRKAASMIMKKEHGFLLPPLTEESGSPVPGEPDVGSSPALSQGVSSVVNALRPSKTPAPGNIPRALSRTASRAATAMSQRPLT